MKKILSVILSVILVLSMSVIAAGADSAAVESGVEVFVTIADAEGNTAVAAQQIAVTDIDADGALTIHDALYAAHERFYDGGAAAGYETSVTQYGLSLQKLWGTANGGSYGYYVNNASAWALTDHVKDGDYIAAFVYTDPVYWTDHYSFFDRFAGDVKAGKSFTLTYCEAGYDADWNPVTLPVEGAVITVDGEATAFATDAKGKATVTLNEGGVHTVSAIADGKRLVAPVFIATVELSAEVFVTIADAEGNTAVAAQQIAVTDIDADGALTIHDALYAAHEKFYDGAAAAGYETSVTQYGLSLQKLWGTANGGSYGYYVNNASAWALTDPVEDGDYIAAFVYTDPVYWTDHYSFFDRFAAKVAAGQVITLTYSEAGYDADWNPITLPVGGAVVAIDDEMTAFTTDADGKVVITITDEGVHTVTAIADDRRLVAPVFIAEVDALIIGDADGDGKVTVLDATRIQRWLAKLNADYALNFTNADADGDGKVTVLDATRIQRWLAKLVASL